MATARTDALGRLRVLAARHDCLPPDQSDAYAIAHELAHALRPGDEPDRGRPCRGQRRVEADLVAHWVLTELGIASRPPFAASAPWGGPDVGDRVVRLGEAIVRHVRAPSRSVLADAQEFFLACARVGWVPAYLAGRGFGVRVQRRWQIGWAPPEAGALTARLRDLGHPDESIVAAGLARRGRGGRLRDVFRDRATFPLRTADGTIAGFIGRRADGGRGPKYLNSPSSELFHKSELLFGLYESRGPLARGARPVLVEGPLDAVAVALTGRPAVATCGVAFTPGQLAALSAAADLDRTGLLVAFDGDASGLRAARRVWRVTRASDSPRPVHGPLDHVQLPAGTDPAGLLADGGRPALREALRSPRPLLDLVVDDALDRSLDTVESRLAAARAVAAAIALGRPNDSARQVVRVASRLQIPPSLMTEILTDTISPP
ncbi:toprim domain-containing protein [Actinomadura gamaensis]|uniref:Toprim domain-containing protein n=1 Tax=Actinomadura gamaensis TaxID=1763541 RepID=A0ABV9U6J3_9ACTN